MTPDAIQKLGSKRAIAIAVIGVAAAAFFMGLPTIRGGFVGGDDHRLALNHVYVNHPSFAHAIKLFTIQHRDLYQPLPLLTFQLEFLTAQSLNLFRQGPAAAGRLFHMNNVILHSLNAVLVLLAVSRLQRHVSRAGVPADSQETILEQENSAAVFERASPFIIGCIAGILFAVHPLQVETIAWLNGRMMLLSTFFLLLTLILFSSWLDRPRTVTALLTPICALLCSISKVRIEMPVLLLIVAYVRRRGYPARFWSLWIPVTFVAALFTWINVETTTDAELFQQGAEHLRGPRLVRILMALAFYFQHIVWPTGLCSYYPTPPVVAWSDAATWKAAIIVLPTLVLMAWAAWRSRVARMGVVWFFATVFATLPIFPARNVLAADRYMYVPLIGLFWIIAAGANFLIFYHRCSAVVSLSEPRASARAVSPDSNDSPGPFLRLGSALIGGFGIALIPTLIAVGWHTAKYYESPILKTQRVAELFPDTPRVWEPYGWSLHGEGRFEEAQRAALMELRHDAPKVRSGAYQLLAMCEFEQGRIPEAVELLKQALNEDPDNGLGMYRLALVFDRIGRLEEAAKYYEGSARIAPMHNPSLNRLAVVYRKLGRASEARELYARALTYSHGYDVVSLMGLVELDLEEGTNESLLSARRRLEELLSWMPENLDARTNLGVVWTKMGRPAEAAKEYEEVLRRAPNHVTALLNLAQLYIAANQPDRAAPLMDRAAGIGPLTIAQALTIHDFLVDRRSVAPLPAMWEKLTVRADVATETVAPYLAWAHALAGDVGRARQILSQPRVEESADLVAQAAGIYLDLCEENLDSAIHLVQSARLAAPDAVRVRQQLLAALQFYDAQHPDQPWTFCLAAWVLIADGNFEAARLSLDLFEKSCQGAPCDLAVAELLRRVER